MQMLDFLARLLAKDINLSLSGILICLIILQTTVSQRVGKTVGGGVMCVIFWLKGTDLVRHKQNYHEINTWPLGRVKK